MPLTDDRQVIVTTSWDDGHPLDSRIAELLAKYGLKGTFYIPVKNDEHEVMDERGVLDISSRFEIGGHTENHVDLTSISAADAYKEIEGGKKMVEDILGRELKVFAYPRGRYNKNIKELVKRAGFSGARSASWFHGGYPEDLYCIHPTLHVYPHSSLVHIGHLLKELNIKVLRDYLFFDRGVADLKSLTARWFDRIMSEGGILHIWGHSWEIEEFRLWMELEEIISYISQFKSVVHMTNGEIISEMEKDIC